MKLLIFAISLVIVAVSGGAAPAHAQAYVFPPPPLHRTRTNWYTPRAQKTPAPSTSKVAPPVVPLTPAQAAAKVQLDRMGSTLNGAEGVEFTSTVTYAATAGGTPSTKQAVVAGTVERYVRLQIQATTGSVEDGQIVADGSLFTLYDSLKNKYVQITTSRDLWSIEQALSLGGKELFPKATESSRALRYSVEFPLLFLEKVFDQQQAPTGETLNYVATPSTSADGKAVLLITQSLSSPTRGVLSGTWMIDPVTNLPVEYTQIENKPGQNPRTDFSITFTSFKLLHRPLSVSTYSFSPPVNASAIAGSTQ